MSETSAVSQKRTGSRSPSYPDLDLSEAIARASQLWDREKQNEAPVNTILEHWGFQPNSGTGMRAIAALGLIDN